MGQTDTVLTIPEIEITASKIRTSPVGGTSKNWTAEEINSLPEKNMAELLQSESGVFIKTYGLGSLATSSIRGGSAGHTLVLWNGMPIQSPMLGLLDLSLLPVQGMEEISFSKGGNSALWGSGAIGGVLSLNNLPDFYNKILTSSQTSVGSFGNVSQQFKIGLGNSRVQSVTKVFHQQAENDFFYEIAPNFPKRQQTNAQFSQQNIMQDLYWKIDKKNQVSAHFWRQISERQIPPTNQQTRSLARQDDRSTRVSVDWKHIGEGLVWNGKLGHVREDLDYFDDATELESLSQFNSWLGELDVQKTWKKQHKFYAAMTHIFTEARIENYRTPPRENKTALLLSYQFFKNNWQMQASLRQEIVDSTLVPLTPSLGFNYDITRHLQIKGKVSRNYRLPTMNDRFWFPGGNENLLPESGWSEEMTMTTWMNRGAFRFDFSMTGFNRNINQWILWAPVEGDGFWSANNLTEVWSRGLEPRFSVFYQENNFNLRMNLGYDYVRSTNQVGLTTPRILEGEQLLYTPIHQAFSRLNLSWKNWEFSYQHLFNGKSSGSNEDLPAYHVAHTQLQYQRDFGKCKSLVFFKIHNLWNSNYFVVERRPMPGIHYQLGINFLFQNKLNH